MSWSKEPPTEPGWYWWSDGVERSEIVEIQFSKDGPQMLLLGGWERAARGEWSERIQEPVSLEREHSDGGI